MTNQITAARGPADSGGSGTRPDRVAPAAIRWMAILRLLGRQRRVLGRAALLGLAAGIVAAVAVPVHFVSMVRFVPEKQSSSSLMSKVGGLADLQDSGLSLDLLGLKGTGALYVAVLSSRTVQDRMIDRFDLMHLYHCWYRTQARQKLAGRTSVGEDRKSNVVTLTASDPDPQRAGAMARAYIEEMNRVLASVNTSAAHRERLFVEERMGTVRADLQRAEERLSAYSSQNATIDLSIQGKAMVEGVASLKGQLIASQAELRGLEQIYSADNPRMRAARARVAELEAQMKRLGVAGEEGEIFPDLRKLPLLGVEYANLAREVRIDEIVLLTLAKQYEAAKIDETKDLPSISVIDEGDVPEDTGLWQRLLRVLALVGIAVLGVAGWLVAVELSPELAGTARYLKAEAARGLARTRPEAPPEAGA